MKNINYHIIIFHVECKQNLPRTFALLQYCILFGTIFTYMRVAYPGA